jgi:hypothetical protein
MSWTESGERVIILAAERITEGLIASDKETGQQKMAITGDQLRASLSAKSAV